MALGILVGPENTFAAVEPDAAGTLAVNGCGAHPVSESASGETKNGNGRIFPRCFLSAAGVAANRLEQLRISKPLVDGPAYVHELGRPMYSVVVDPARASVALHMPPRRPAKEATF